MSSDAKAKIIMSQSKSTSSNPGSDEYLYRLIDSSPIHHNLETTLLQDAFATRLGKEAKSQL